MLRDRQKTIYQKLELGGEKVPLEIDFIATTLDDKEVYDIRLGGNHYGYMTEEMFRSLKKVDPLEGDNNLDKLYFDLKEGTLKMNQKVILDAPKELYPNYRKIALCRTEYSDELSKTITIRPTSEFCLKSSDSFLEFNFPNDTLEVDNFCIFNKNNKKSPENRRSVYNLSFDEGIASTIIIERMDNVKDICLNVEMGKDGYLTISNFANNMPSISIKAKESITLTNAHISTTPYVDKDYSKNAIFDCGNYLQAKDSELYFYQKNDDKFGVKAEKGISVESSKLIFTDFNKVKTINVTDSKNFLGKDDKMVVTLEKSQIESKLFCEPYNLKRIGGPDKLLDHVTIKDSRLNNGDNNIELLGSVNIKESTIENNNNASLILSCFRADRSSFKNINSLSFGAFFSAEVENFSLKNKNYRQINEDKNNYLGSFRVGNLLEESDKKIVTIKNCTATLGEDDDFSIHGNATFKIENSIFNGNFSINDTFLGRDEKNSNLSFAFNNCLFNDTDIITYCPFDSFLADNSEFKGRVELKNIESISKSVISNSLLEASSNGIVEEAVIADYTSTPRDFKDEHFVDANTKNLNKDKIDVTTNKDIEIL